MRGMAPLALAAAATLASGCSQNGRSESNGDSDSGALTAAPAVPLVNSAGEIIGDVRGGDSDNGARLLIEARGLPPGEHGLHIHDIGICQQPDFKSAGPHWNPMGAQHGGENPKGAHLGDLQNVTVGQDGVLRAEIVVPGTYLRAAGRDAAPGARQILDSSGAALVLHAKTDDYKTDPSGNSGDRIACAVLGSPQPGAIVNPEGGNAASRATGNAAADAATVTSSNTVATQTPEPRNSTY